MSNPASILSRAALVVGSVLLLAAPKAQAEVPPFMQYQGYLTSMTDEPISGFFTMSFALYAQAESGEPLWSEEREGVEVAAGRFSLRLGDRTPIDGAVFRQGQLYLQVTVEGDTLAPREAVSSVAHAFHAAVADDVTDRAIHPRSVSIGEQVVIDEQGRWVGDATGLRGPQGDQGIQGEQGVQGERGIQGEQGVRGAQGFQGDQGLRGASGPQGDRGSQGEAGLRGERGLTGDRGAQGPTGDRGSQGERGAQGDQGDQGIQGFIGPMPEHGWDGTRLRLQNADRSWGDYVDLRGAQGPQGATGAQGAAGPQGDRGVQGEQGAAGPSPQHAWDGTRLRFQNPDGAWGDYVELRAPLGAVRNLVQLRPANGQVSGTPRSLTDDIANGRVIININGRTEVSLTYDLGGSFRMVPFDFRWHGLRRGRYYRHECRIDVAPALTGPWERLDNAVHDGSGDLPSADRSFERVSNTFRFLRFVNAEDRGQARNNLNDYTCEWTQVFPQAFVP